MTTKQSGAAPRRGAWAWWALGLWALWGLWAPTTSLAQFNGTQDCQVNRALPGGVPYELARGAHATNAKLFGAVTTLKNIVLPELAAAVYDAEALYRYAGGQDDERSMLEQLSLDLEDLVEWERRGTVVHYGTMGLYGLTKVPVSLTGCDANVGIADFDLGAVNFGLGFRTGPLTLFYSASVTSGVLVNSAFDRALGTGIVATYGGVYTIMAPVFGAGTLRNGDGVSAIEGDYIAGGELDLGLVTAAAGYIGSSGFYASIDQRRLKLYARAAVQNFQESSELSYLQAGKDGFDWWNRGGWQGSSSASVRKLRLALPNVDDLQGALRDAIVKQLDLWTAHLRQNDIVQIFDLHLAYAWRPQAQVREFRLSVHTPGFNIAQDPTQRRRAIQDDLLWGMEVSGYIGTVNLPRMAFFGIGDEQRLAIGVEALFPMEDGTVNLKAFRNDPEILDIFPFAADAWQFQLSATFAFGQH